MKNTYNSFVTQNSPTKLPWIQVGVMPSVFFSLIISLFHFSPSSFPVVRIRIVYLRGPPKKFEFAILRAVYLQYPRSGERSISIWYFFALSLKSSYRVENGTERRKDSTKLSQSPLAATSRMLTSAFSTFIYDVWKKWSRVWYQAPRL